jgi:acyl-CoA thioester hydrolase
LPARIATGRSYARPPKHRICARTRFLRALRLFGDARRGCLDRCVDEAYELIGCGLAYLEQTRHSTFTAEVHVRYLRELHAGDPVRVTFQLLDYDAKRIHYFEELRHAEEGWLSATSENMTLHVDMTAKKTAPFPDFIAARLARMKAAHAHLPQPDGVGRRIAMPGK